ncbi:neuronal acetylcholine receptor subunit alpha-7-like [Littorina saxatilis]|uniref:neuronal acetylcholine receptor subunit alpha-7-like n=1 Tax=Littorina saxatilis TaxID=31220 RepID=UPI0038B4B8B2
MLLHVSFSLMFCVSASLTRPYNQRQAESSLIQMLLADYDPDVRPVLNHTSSVSVHLMFTPVRIDDLDLRGEDLKLTGWLGMTWTDEMFQWQPRNESGVRYLLLSHKDYWVPPITVLNR